MSRIVLLLMLVSGALFAPAAGAAVFGNQCQYSYDKYWRPVPMVFGGALTAPVAVGDAVTYKDGTLSAILPSWISTFAYESGMIPLGDGEFPIRAWLALEATNTAEGVLAPIPLNTVARTHVVLTPQGIVDEERSSVLVDQAPLPAQTWTATGGEVVVRQALGDSLPPLPIGRDGGLVRVRGSLYVEATLTFPSGDVFRLYLDCLQGDQVDQGAAYVDALPGSLGVYGVPGWTGSVDGVPLSGPVDADLLNGAGPPHAGAGVAATLRSSVLRLRLTDAQRSAWFGGASSAVIAGAVELVGVGSVEGAQTVPVSGSALTLALPDTVWTASGDSGISISGSRQLVLDATAGGVTRQLTLTRISASDPYPFARILRPAPPVSAVPPPGVVVPPVPSPARVVVVPKPALPKLTVRSTKLKVSGTRIPVALACASAACRGTLVLRTTSGRVLTKRASYALGAGRRSTVRLTLSASGRKYLRSHRKVTTRLAVKLTGGAAATRTLTLKR